MNCRDINHLLDAGLPVPLTNAQSEAIGAHLASCRACSEEWTNWRDMAALEVPATPATLRARIAAALPAQAVAPPRRSVRPYIVGSVLVAMAAAAAVTLQMSRPVPAVTRGTDPAREAPAVVGVAADAASMASATDAAAPSLQPSSDDGVSAADTTTAVNVDDVVLDPRTILVLKRPEAAADAAAIMIANQCHDALVAELRVPEGLTLITGLPPTPEAERPYPLAQADRDLARARGAGHVLTISTENGCRATFYDTPTGMPGGGAMHGQLQPPADGWRMFATSIALNIRDRVQDDPAAVLARHRATLLNTSLSDTERAMALSKLELARQSRGSAPRGSMRDGAAFDKEMVAAAIQLGTRSSIAGVRGSVWAYLRGSTDPQLVAPLLQALASDPDATVRMQAAYSLKSHLDAPGVREGLLHAATNDPDSKAQAACCIQTVREAAERSAVPDAQFRTWVRGKLLDDSLPARSRLFALQNSTPDGQFIASLIHVGNDAARIVFDIGRREQDPDVRTMAWNALQRAPADASFLPVLLGDLASHTDEGVRAAAAEVLMLHRNNTEVLEALERAQNDPSMEVRRVVTRTRARFQP